MDEMAALVISCDGKHQHDEWKVESDGRAWHFSTQDEAAYPKLLCTRVAAIVKQHLEKKGFTFVEDQSAEEDDPVDESKKRSAARQAEAGRQPRGTKLRQIIPEFSRK